MIVECGTCCAPLDADGTSAFVKCSYCGSSNKVRSMKTLSAITPSDWRPPPQWQPPPQVAQHALQYGAAASAASAGISGCATVLVGVVLVLVLGGVAAAIALRSSPVLAPSWDGTTPLRCGGNESVRVENVVAELPGQTAITVEDNCTFEIVGSSITAWEGIAARGNHRVVLRDTVIVSEGNGITARGNRNIELQSSTISAGGVGIEAHGNVDVLLVGGRVAGTPQAVRTMNNAELEVRGAELVDGAR